jgi:hypothetical protein
MCILVVLRLSSSPFDPVENFRTKITSDQNLLNIEEVDKAYMIYSVGKANNENDNIFFADMTKRTLFGYKWIGGGGHIDRQIGNEEPFVFSAQLLNEDQNVRPTIIGFLLDKEIDGITVITNNERSEAIIFNDQEDNIDLFYIPLSKDVAQNSYFIFEATFADGTKSEHKIPDEKIDDFQLGKFVGYLRSENE